MLRAFKYKLLSSFIDDTQGAIVIILAFLLLPFIVIMGGSVDFVRISNTSAHLEKAVETAALAAAALTNKGDLNKTIDTYVRKNLPSGDYWNTLKITSEVKANDKSSRKIAVEASVTIDTPFLALIGHKQTTVTASSSAQQEAQNTEVSLVVDISSSMRGSKLVELKSASKEFLDLMLEGDLANYTSINLIPFGGTVNIGYSLLSRYYPLNNYSQGTYPSYFLETDLSYGRFRFLGAQDCMEYRPEDFDLRDIPSNSRSQVPHFYYYSIAEPWCPTNFNTKIWLNRNNLDELKAAIDRMETSNGTGTDIGLLWGVKALSPELRTAAQIDGGSMPGRPADWEDKGTLKVLILMTDGDISFQTRPKDPWKNVNPQDYRDGGMVNARGNNQIMVQRGSMSSSPNAPHNAMSYFKKMCNLAKSQNVIVYTVGFQIQRGTLEDHSLAYCATSPSHYLFVETSALNEAFEAIAASIKSLRIVG